MRKMMVLIMMILMVSAVSAQVSEIPEADTNFRVPDGTFGEKDNFWNSVGDFLRSVFGGQEFAFTSDVPEYGIVSYTWYEVYPDNGGYTQVTSSTDTAIACDFCSVGEFCEIHYYAYGEWKIAFADYWYKSYSSDVIDLVDSQWWTSNTGFDYYAGYYCYEPVELVQYEYTCRDDDYFVKVYQDGDLIYSQSTAKCVLSTSLWDEELSDSDIRNFIIESVDTCYQCSGGKLLTEAQDGCERGWSTTKPTCLTCYDCDTETGLDTEYASNSCPSGYTQTKPSCQACYSCDDSGKLIKEYRSTCVGEWSSTQPICETPTVTCHSCSNGQVAVQKVDGTTCPAGTSKTEPSTCPVTCYSCEGEEAVSEQYAGGCPDGWATNQPDCTIENVECFACQEGDTGVVLKEIAPECSEGYSTKELSKEDCLGEETSFIDDIVEWFQDESPQSYIIAVSAVLIFGALIAVLGRKPKKGVSL